VKQLGFRAGNWLSAFGDSMRAKRDYAMLSMLFGCGFRRSELVGLQLNEIQIRQGHWACHGPFYATLSAGAGLSGGDQIQT
jgi:integrase